MIPVLFLLMLLPLLSVEKSGRDVILENNVWKQIHEDYQPEQALMDILRSKASKINSVDIYFAFWCGDSENNVPPFIKILDELGTDGVKVNYFTAARKKPGEKFYFEKLNVVRIPTFIFFNDGKEIGRIVENPKKTLEEDLLEILF